jgi:TPR repeat protein
VKIHWISNEWGAAMSNPGQGAAQAVIPIPLAPKLNSRAEAVDQLDRAAQTILGTINRAASATEANYRQTVEMTRKLTAQLRAAEDRISELEVNATYHQDRADRAEKWLYQISVEIEQKFLGRNEDNSQPPPVISRAQRR